MSPGDQAGLWAGFDDRGVPHLNAKAWDDKHSAKGT